MPNSKKDKKQNKTKRRITISLVIIISVIIFDLTPPFGGTIKFYSTWIKCGQKPVVTVGALAGYWPTYKQTPSVNILPGNRSYFCTAFEAEKHGYSTNPNYPDFPVLKQNDALCHKPDEPKSETLAMFPEC